MIRAHSHRLKFMDDINSYHEWLEAFRGKTRSVWTGFVCIIDSADIRLYCQNFQVLIKVLSKTQHTHPHTHSWAQWTTSVLHSSLSVRVSDWLSGTFRSISWRVDTSAEDLQSAHLCPWLLFFLKQPVTKSKCSEQKSVERFFPPKSQSCYYVCSTEV